MKIKEFVELTFLNTIRLKSCARYYLLLQNEKELVEISAYIKLKSLKFFALGGGSNILLPELFEGLVIHNKIQGIQKIAEDDEFVFIKAGAGTIWDDFVKFCIENAWFGLENLSWIPGTVGASPVQNISAYGVDVREFIDSLEVFDLATGKAFSLREKDCGFAYRNSIFKGEPNLLVTSVVFSLRKTPRLNLSYRDVAEHFKERNTEKVSALDLRNLIINIRKQKLPDPALFPNVGSFFHNPIVDKLLAEKLHKDHCIPIYEVDCNRAKLSAGWLIENLGLKGFRNGNVGVYEKHALVLLNYSSATQKEILDFAKLIKDKVYKKFNVVINIEPIVVN